MINLKEIYFLNEIIKLSNFCEKDVLIEIYKNVFLYIILFKDNVYLFVYKIKTNINSFFLIDLKKFINIFNKNNFINFLFEEEKLTFKRKNEIIVLFKKKNFFNILMNSSNFFILIKKNFLDKLIIEKTENIKFLDFKIKALEFYIFKNSIFFLNYTNNIIIIKIFKKKFFITFFLKLLMFNDLFFMLSFEKILLLYLENLNCFFINKIKINFNKKKINLIIKNFKSKFLYIIINLNILLNKKINYDKNTILKLSFKKNNLNLKFNYKSKIFNYNIKIFVKNIKNFIFYVNLKNFISIIKFHKQEIFFFYSEKKKQIVLSDYNISKLLTESSLSLYDTI